jgi:hypothetical protein
VKRELCSQRRSSSPRHDEEVVVIISCSLLSARCWCITVTARVGYLTVQYMFRA